LQTIFLAPNERDDPRLGIAEDAVHFFERAKTGKPIRIEETLAFA